MSVPSGVSIEPKTGDTIEAGRVGGHFEKAIGANRWITGLAKSTSGLTLTLLASPAWEVVVGGYHLKRPATEPNHLETLADDDTNYVFVAPDFNIEVNVTGVPTNPVSMLIWTFTAVGGSVTAFTDERSSTFDFPDEVKADGFDANSNPINNVSDPVSGQQAATKAYVDQEIDALPQNFKTARVATAAAGTLASDFEDGDTVDGVVLATGDRILIKNQAAPAENGLYTVAASGAPVRATDLDDDIEAASGLQIAVSEGTVNADTVWSLTTNAPITVGVTGLTFVRADAIGATSSPTALKHMQRDSAGRAQVVAPVAGADNANIPTTAWVRDNTYFGEGVETKTADFTAETRKRYFVNHATPATQAIATLPESPASGDHIMFIGGANTGGFRVKENGTSQEPILYRTTSSAGTGSGYVEAIGDVKAGAALHLYFDGTVWRIFGGIGSFQTDTPVVFELEHRAVDVQVFTSNGTWTKPFGAKQVEAIVIGAGGGATGGARITVTNTVGGGAGGGGGAYNRHVFDPSVLGPTEAITVGAGGAGGAGQTGGSGSGSPGTAGGQSSFGSHLLAFGGGTGGVSQSIHGGGGGGGIASVGADGVTGFGGAGGAPLGGAESVDAIFGGGGGSGNTTDAGNSVYGGGGGGAGGADPTRILAGGSSMFGGPGGGGGGGAGGSASEDGEAGGTIHSFVQGGGAAAGAGADGGAAGAGANGTSRSGTGKCGDGGGGGGGCTTSGSTGVGGDGGAPGAGGGGGGGANDSIDGADGGDGARGEVIITTFF